jgi:hypothetical protein
MNISNFATRDNSEQGQWLQVIVNGIKMPFDLKILGTDSDAVQKYNRQRLRSGVFGKVQAGKFDEMTDEDYETLDDHSDEAVLVRLVDIRGYKYAPEDKKQRLPIGYEDVNLFDHTIKATGNEKETRENFKFLIYHIPAIKDFVLEKSRQRENFLLERKET